MANTPKRNPLQAGAEERERAAVALLTQPERSHRSIAREVDAEHHLVDNTAQEIDTHIKEGRASFLSESGGIAHRALAKIGEQLDEQPYPLVLRTYGVLQDKWTALAYPPAHTLVQTGQIVNVNVDPDTAQALKRMEERMNSVDNRNDADTP
jgi:hypothetical protein